MWEVLKVKKIKLNHAISQGRSKKWCLNLWSDFIRTRDNYRCVNCHSTKNLQAHHIIRKTVCLLGAYEIGNGITLCGDCHWKIHKQFNGKPLLNEPFNARGGDDQDEIAYLYGILNDDAIMRGMSEDEFYYLSDEFISFMNKYQGYGLFLENIDKLAISRIRLAHEIWRIMPKYWYKEIGNEILYQSLIFEDGEN